jgi:hypothetical protein
MALRTITGLCLAVLAAMAPTALARADMLCHERAVIVESLKVVYAELPRAVGVTADGAVLEVLASPAGSWTVLITYPSLSTCVLAAGEAWETLPVHASGPPA